jgi:hypothetical protein
LCQGYDGLFFSNQRFQLLVAAANIFHASGVKLVFGRAGSKPVQPALRCLVFLLDLSHQPRHFALILGFVHSKQSFLRFSKKRRRGGGIAS